MPGGNRTAKTGQGNVVSPGKNQVTQDVEKKSNSSSQNTSNNPSFRAEQENKKQKVSTTENNSLLHDSDGSTSESPVHLTAYHDNQFLYPSDDLISLNTVTQETNPQMQMINSSDKFMLCRIIQATRYNSENAANKPIYYSKFKGDSSSRDGGFNRMLYFYDINDEYGHVAVAVFKKTPTEELSNLRLQNMHRSIVGQVVLLREPVFQNKWFYGSLPIINLDKDCSVLSIDPKIKITAKNTIPINTSITNDMKIYRYLNAVIKIISISFFPSCKNVFCDRSTSISECF